ncbi:hypothetical protein [Kitasatospora sp. NPDC088346]|uniref:hypothetical protein n=1 Tax=Kitasatospora sp. NPDC088346 TaxID=3364073 RepID=UPI003822EB46
MTTALANEPVEYLTDGQIGEGRVSLAELAALGADELVAQLRRALPGGVTNQVSVAAFQSSI